MKEVQDTIGPLPANPQEAISVIESHLRRMQNEIWQLRNKPINPRTVSGFQIADDGGVRWE